MMTWVSTKQWPVSPILILYEHYQAQWRQSGNDDLSIKRVIQILRAASDGCRPWPWLACWPANGPLYSRCFRTLTLLFQFIFRVDGHAHRRTFANVSVYWLWLLLYVSALSVGIVIIAICDMPRQEFTLCECVYIQNTYMKSRKSCSETRRKFRVNFPGGPVPNPSTIMKQAKRFKETGSIKNRKVNRWHHILKEETLDEIGERLEHTPQKSLKCLSQETGVSVSSVQRATKLHIHIVNIHTFAQWEFLSKHVTNHNHNHYT